MYGLFIHGSKYIFSWTCKHCKSSQKWVLSLQGVLASHNVTGTGIKNFDEELLQVVTCNVYKNTVCKNSLFFASHVLFTISLAIQNKDLFIKAACNHGERIFSYIIYFFMVTSPYLLYIRQFDLF